MKRFISFMLAAIMLVAMIPLGAVSVNAAQSVVNRDDGVWLFPVDNYSFSDWAGCNTTGIYHSDGGYYTYTYGPCPFHGSSCKIECSAAHYQGPYGHNGIDINASYISVKASAYGKVIYADRNGSRGKVIVIEHKIQGTSYSYYSFYQHLSSMETSLVGEYVSAGTIIGVSGQSGNGDYDYGPHLHFGIYRGASGLSGGSVLNNEWGSGWLINESDQVGRIVVNPANGGTDLSSVNSHCGSVRYTFNASEVTIKTPAPSKPILNDMKPLYNDNEEIVFTWDPTSNTTHYNLYIRTVESEEDTDYTHSYETIHYAESGLTRTFPAGHYRVLIQSTNSNASWVYTDGDWIYFEVQQAECQHNLTAEIISNPTCIENGLERTTCSICGETWDREIPALGHNYEISLVPGSCIEPAVVVYTCTRCGDTYSEIEHSEWSETYPEGIDWEDVSFKTQYRSSVKETMQSSQESVDGWDRGEVVDYEYSEYGEWSDWAIGSMTETEVREVESGLMYRYYYFLCDYCGTHNAFKGTCDCGKPLGDGNWRCDWFPVSYADSQSKVYQNTSSKRYTTSLGDGLVWFFSSGNINDKTPGTIDSGSSDEVIKDGYRYRDRSKLPVYEYSRWSDFSEWQDEYIEASDEVKVETRTVYRYKIPVQGHNYEAVVTSPSCTEQGYTTYTCTRCGDSYVDDIVPAAGHNFVDGVCTVCGAADPDYVPVDPNGPKASVAEAVAKAGEDVEISVTLDNAPEIKSMAISDVTFNLETLALLGGEWNVDNSVLSSWDESTGKGVVTLKSAEDLNGNVVFTLTFHVSDAADEGFYSISLKVSAKDKNNAAINVATVTGGVTVRNYIVGDVNGDGEITDEDAIYLLFYTFFPEEYPIEQPCDFNGDGEVTDEDAIYLLFYTFFPEEYPIA